MDQDDFQVVGPAVGAGALLTALMVSLVAKGVITKEERRHLMDAALLILDGQEKLAGAERAELWLEAKSYISNLKNVL